MKRQQTFVEFLNAITQAAWDEARRTRKNANVRFDDEFFRTHQPRKRVTP